MAIALSPSQMGLNSAGTKRLGTGSLRKALRLVTELGVAEAEGLRLTELVGRTDIDTLTAYRMLACLVEAGFLQKLEGKRYRLGQRVFELGLVAGQHFNEPVLAKSTLRRLVDRLRATMVLNARSGGETVYVERMEGPDSFPGLRQAVGTRLPIGVGSGGVALLAAMAVKDAETLMHANERRYRTFGRNTAQVLRRHLDRARVDGFASTTSFFRADVAIIGIVVPGDACEPTFTLSIVCPASRLCESSELVSELRIAAHEVASAISAGRASVASG